MRKLWCCVLMMSLLLSACSGGSGAGEAEELAMTIRGEYLEMTDCTMTAAITADYGQRVYEYEMKVVVTGEETTLTLTAPDTVAGITAKVTGADSTLEYEGLSLETGPLNEDGLTPVSAVPALLEAARSGYITACTMEGDESGPLLRVDCGDPEGTVGKGTETTLWFHPESHALVQGEISTDGYRVILLQCSEFTKEKKEST